MTKKVDTWMPLLVDKYLGDTTDLTTEQHGAYLLLLMTMWKKGGALPNIDETLMTITHLAPARWRVHKQVLLGFFRLEDGQLRQKRLTQELRRAEQSTSAKSVAGKKGAANRWQKDDTANGKLDDRPDDEADDRSDDKSIADAMPTRSQTDASIPTPSSLRSDSPHPADVAVDPTSARVEAEAGGQEPNAYGIVCRALRRAGISDAAPHQLRFRTLVDAGATAEEFLALVPQALRVGDKPFAYLLGAVEGERKRAALTATQLHNGPMPGTPEATPWYETKGGVKAKGQELGLQYTRADDCEPFDRYKARVIKAARQAEHVA